MEYRLEIAPRALREIEEAHDWIAQHSARSAERWQRGLWQKIDSLSTLPERCGLADEEGLAARGIRQLLYGKRRNVYRILFTVIEDVVRVLSVWHSARGPVKL